MGTRVLWPNPILLVSTIVAIAGVVALIYLLRHR
jgi:hypothetical protein